jgi:alkaline phosphatase
VVLLLVALCAGAQAQTATPKNIIVFISDGWGYSQLDATAYWNGQRATYEENADWTELGMTNYMYHLGNESAPYGEGGFVGIYGYDPAQAWGDWYYQQNFATDSAAAATAMSTGLKTYKGSICWSVDGQPMQNILEYADTLGKSTGVVSSVQLSHATPAGYIAHNPARGNYAEIAQEMVQNSGLDVLMGAGHPNYGSNGQWQPGIPGSPGDWKYVGGYDQWQDLVAGTAGGAEPWTLIDEKADFEALADGTLVLDRVFGCAQVASTLQHDRAGYPDFNEAQVPYEDPFIGNVPSLETMARGALNVLGQNPNGFVVMFEGGAIDWAGHGRALERLIEEQDDFNAAVDAAIAWVEANSSWDETVIVVTGDHETGYLWGPGVDPADPSTWFAPIQDNGPGNVPGFYFYSAPNDDWQNPAGSAGHTNQVIPFYVRGAGADYIASFADESDPSWGAYLDNTELGLACFDLLMGSVPVENPEQPADEVPVAAIALEQNFPNPFNPQTNIAFSLPRTEQVRLEIVDLQGRHVRTLIDEARGAGQHSVVWNGTSDSGQRVASGTYVYRLITDSLVQSKTMVLVK